MCGLKRLTCAAGMVASIISVGALGKQARPARPTMMDLRGDHSSSAWIVGRVWEGIVRGLIVASEEVCLLFITYENLTGYLYLFLFGQILNES